MYGRPHNSTTSDLFRNPSFTDLLNERNDSSYIILQTTLPRCEVEIDPHWHVNRHENACEELHFLYSVHTPHLQGYSCNETESGLHVCATLNQDV